MNPSRGLRSRVLAAVVVALLAVACSDEAKGGSSSTSTPTAVRRPSSTANLKILSPANGEVIVGSTAGVRVRLSGARIIAATTNHIVPDEGHLHVYLDNRITSMNFSKRGTIGDLKPGMHVLRVEFVASDHAPFDPRNFTSVTFEVMR